MQRYRFIQSPNTRSDYESLWDLCVFLVDTPKWKTKHIRLLRNAFAYSLNNLYDTTFMLCTLLQERSKRSNNENRELLYKKIKTVIQEYDKCLEDFIRTEDEDKCKAPKYLEALLHNLRSKKLFNKENSSTKNFGVTFFKRENKSDEKNCSPKTNVSLGLSSDSERSD